MASVLVPQVSFKTEPIRESVGNPYWLSVVLLRIPYWSQTGPGLKLCCGTKIDVTPRIFNIFAKNCFWVKLRHSSCQQRKNQQQTERNYICKLFVKNWFFFRARIQIRWRDLEAGSRRGAARLESGNTRCDPARRYAGYGTARLESDISKCSGLRPAYCY